jgi:4-alpha-glucanotransferase
VTDQPDSDTIAAESGAAQPAPAPDGQLLDLESDPPPELTELATAYGVATEFWDWRGQPVTVQARTITAVLAGLDVVVQSLSDVTRELERARLRPWRQVLPDVLVVREGAPGAIPVHLAKDRAAGGNPVEVWLELEDGEVRQLPAPGPSAAQETAEVGGATIVRLKFAVPEDVPLGWHTMHVRDGATQVSRPFVVTPVRMQLPEVLETGRAWGFMTQLYSVRSARSWGLGDLGDLTDLIGWSGRTLGAGFVLVNPMHAAEPVSPMEPSPYLPVTRRFFNPVYLRIEDIREVAYLPSTERAIVEWQAEAMQALNTDDGLLDRDAVWGAKLPVLETIFACPRSSARQAAFEAFCEREGQGLADFATWCALAEQYGVRTAGWPAHALDPRSDAVTSMRREFVDRITFHQWLQWCMDEQLAEVARTAKDAGMPIGVIHDLAVGVHPDGADAWGLGPILARGVSGGAPPDAFNQQGQDWSQAPMRPDRLAASGYASFRDMLRTVLRHAGALRVDHIIGLFRMWWVPAGFSPADGTYVRYDHEALLGILALEAHRAGAFVVGEDLGTVEPWARDYLRERGLLGTSILWFEKDSDGAPLAPQAWRELCLATVTTHDLPPTAGYLAGEHIELRDRLKLLTRPLEEEIEADRADQAAVLKQLTDLGLLGPEPSERDKVEALHAFLALTPSKLLGVALADAVGDRRAMNQPGTTDEYPNWRLPLADGTGRPVLLEELMINIRVSSLAQTLTAAAQDPSASGPMTD